RLGLSGRNASEFGAPIRRARLRALSPSAQLSGIPNHPEGTAAAQAVDQKARTTMKKSPKKLSMNKQTLRVLVGDELADVAGGWLRPPISWSCPQPAPSSSNCPKL